MTNMRALILPSSHNIMPPSEGEKQIAANFAALTANNRKKVVDENLALETAALVEQEVQRWQNSIRELESLLGDANDPGRNGANQPYPIPAIVAMDESDDVRTPETEGQQRTAGKNH